MAKQSFSVGQVLTAAQMTSLQQTAMLGGSATAKTANYTLVAADAGTVVSVNSTSATTITVNTGLFSAGDTVTIQNWGSGAVTITAGTATVNTAGSLIVPQYDGGVLYFTSASAAIYFDWVQAGATSPLTTKGDIWGYGTSDARIPIGANGTILTADSAETLGLKWATPAGGGGMTLIQEVVANADTGIDFTSISGSYKQLLLTWHGIYESNSSTTMSVRFNADSGSNYNYMAGAFRGGSQTVETGAVSDITDGNNGLSPFGYGVTTSALNERAAGYLVIDNYSSSTKLKEYYGMFKFKYSTTSYYDNFVGTYNSTTAITQVNIVRLAGAGTMSNATDTSIRLYGIS
jgi:hypothetical protein